MTDSHIRPQKGAPNGKWSISQRSTAGERVLDVLFCPTDRTHAVGMEWEMRAGLRTGRLIAWCHMCRAPVPTSATVPPTPADIRDKRQAARFTQATRKNDAQARREYIKRAHVSGETQMAIARRLGITKQRVSRILNGGRKAS